MFYFPIRNIGKGEPPRKIAMLGEMRRRSVRIWGFKAFSGPSYPSERIWSRILWGLTLCRGALESWESGNFHIFQYRLIGETPDGPHAPLCVFFININKFRMLSVPKRDRKNTKTPPGSENRFRHWLWRMARGEKLGKTLVPTAWRLQLGEGILKLRSASPKGPLLRKKCIRTRYT